MAVIGQPTGEIMQGVLTILPGRESDLLKATKLAARMKGDGLIADWQEVVGASGLNVILKLDSSPRRRRTIVDEFLAIGYDVPDAR
jgi:hypothetical protein